MRRQDIVLLALAIMATVILAYWSGTLACS
jgi:hypothetical protein